MKRVLLNPLILWLLLVASCTVNGYADPGNPTVLNSLYSMWNEKNQSYATVLDPLEHDRHHEDLGIVAYVFSEHVDDSSELQVHCHTSTAHKRDSNQGATKPWDFYRTLGYVSNRPLPGMVALSRYATPRRDKYSTATASIFDLSSYSKESELGYAYPRYGNSGEAFITYKVGDVTMDFNRVYGGTMWHLTYDGLQYINNYDLGRQNQVSGRFVVDGREFTWAEAGMAVPRGLRDFSDPAQRMGAVCLSAEVNSENQFVSEFMPVEFKFWNTRFLGGDVFSPVLYCGIRVKKKVTLDFRGIKGCYQHWHNVMVGSDMTGLEAYRHEIPGGHFSSLFTRRYVYDLSSSQPEIEDKSDGWSDNSDDKHITIQNTSYRCLIIATDDGRHAFGMMVKDSDDGGSVDRVVMANWKGFDPYPESVGEFSGNTVMITGINEKPYTEGSNVQISYNFVGDLDTVKKGAEELYRIRDLVPW